MNTKKCDVWHRLMATAVAAGFLGFAGMAGYGAATTANAAEVSKDAVRVSPGLYLPPMDPVRGKELFATKGCVVCHAINGVGGTDAPDISADTMSPRMNPFDFVAKMWNHAQGMVAMQEDELGGQITFKNGQEIADIIAFLHDAAVQKSFTEDDIPANIKEKLDSDSDNEGMEHGMKGDMNSGGMMKGGMMKGN